VAPKPLPVAATGVEASDQDDSADPFGFRRKEQEAAAERDNNMQNFVNFIAQQKGQDPHGPVSAMNAATHVEHPPQAAAPKAPSAAPAMSKFPNGGKFAVMPHLAVHLPPLRAPENVRGNEKWDGDVHTGPQGIDSGGKASPDWNWLPEERRQKQLGGAWVGTRQHPHTKVATAAPERSSLPWVQGNGQNAPMPAEYNPPGHFGRPAVQGHFGALASAPATAGDE